MYGKNQIVWSNNPDVRMSSLNSAVDVSTAKCWYVLSVHLFFIAVTHNV